MNVIETSVMVGGDGSETPLTDSLRLIVLLPRGPALV